MTVKAYSYGLLAPENWDEDAAHHIWLQNRLWNQLVEIEHAHQERYDALLRQDPEVDRLESMREQFQAEADAAVDERKQARKAARSNVETPELDQRIESLYAELRGVWDTLKKARKAAAKDLKESIRELEAERKALVKEARQNSGLYWGNYNAVVRSFENGRSQALKQGRRMNFHRFDGSGRFTVQLQGGRSPDELFQPKCAR